MLVERAGRHDVLGHRIDRIVLEDDERAAWREGQAQPLEQAHVLAASMWWKTQAEKARSMLASGAGGPAPS